MFPNPDLSRMSREDFVLYITRTEREHAEFVHQANARIQDGSTRIAGIESRVEELLRRNESLLRQNEDLRQQNDWLRRHLFGVLSERRVLKSLSPPEQLWLDEQMLKPAEEAPPVSTTVKAYERAQRTNPVEFVDADSKLKFDATVPSR